MLWAAAASAGGAVWAENGLMLRRGTAPTPHISIVVEDGVETFLGRPPSQADLDRYQLDFSGNQKGFGHLQEIGWYWRGDGWRAELSYGENRISGVFEEGIGVFNLEPLEMEARARVLRGELRATLQRYDLGHVTLTQHMGVGAERYWVTAKIMSNTLDITFTSQTDHSYGLLGATLDYPLSGGQQFRLGLEQRFYRRQDNLLVLTGHLDF